MLSWEFWQLIHSEPTGSCETSLSTNLKKEKQQQANSHLHAPYHKQPSKNTNHDHKQRASHGQPTDHLSIFCSTGCTTATVFFFTVHVVTSSFLQLFSTPTEVVLFSSQAHITERTAQYGE